MDANKVDIRKAVEARYPGVQIKEVRTMVVRGKRRSQFTRRGRVAGETTAYKKAFVTLKPESEQIDFFEEI
jgi:large subunit ribosomal protein L23